MSGLDLARVEKGEVIPDGEAPKSDFLFFVENYKSDRQYKFRDRTVKAGKISQQMGFVTYFLNGASQENKVKLNESRLLKFYQVKQLKENSTEISAEKNFKEDLQFNELRNFSTKQNRKKKKRKILKFKELCFPRHSLRKVPANCTKICNTIFSNLFFLVSLYEFPF